MSDSDVATPGAADGVGDAPRERWPSRFSFIMAAIGSAVGLGNVWGFPKVAYANGGGAFFIPYFVALLTAGIPLLILEFSVGQMMPHFSLGSALKKGSFSVESESQAQPRWVHFTDRPVFCNRGSSILDSDSRGYFGREKR